MIKKVVAMNVQNRIFVGALILLTVVGTGCQSLSNCGLPVFGFGKPSTPSGVNAEAQQNLTPANAFVSAHYAKLKPRRVVIVPPQNRTALFPEQTRFAEALGTALRRRGVMETVISEPMTCNINAIQSGRFYEEQLVNLASQYNADAVMYCDVTHFSAYAPLSASVSISLVDARESVVLLSTDGAWDLRSPEDAQQFRSLLAQSGDDAEVEMRFDSPSEFMTFVGLLTADFISRF